MNLSIKSGCFPVHWKMSNVVPIPKSTDKSNPHNISLLPILSKFLERHIYHLLSDHLSHANNLITDSQWGFQSGKSTTTALSNITHTWHKSLEAGMEICAVFLDLQKAFDSVSHQNLLQIMKQMGIYPLLLAWTCSYLTGRSQRVVVDSATSSEVHAKSGVPQGSVAVALLDLHRWYH